MQVVLKTISVFEHCVSDYAQPLIMILPSALTNYGTQATAVRLLAVLIDSGTMEPELYDLMERVPELLLESNRVLKPVANLYLDFLLKYPMTKARREFHLGFLARNLMSASPEGRMAML
jgi:hypothetical protein